MQDDAGADRRPLGIVDREAAFTGRLPAKRLLGSGGAAHHLDALGNQERAVETDPELPDQLRQVARLGALLLQLVQKFARARPSDRAEALLQLLLPHADAVVPNRQRGLLLVRAQP